jgi:hypothetical protein
VVKTEITIPLPNGTSTLADVYRPQGPGPFPVVVHAYGLLQNKAREAGTATHYASWGLVTVVPKLPFGSGAPPRNAPVLQDIVDWVGKRPSTLGPIDLTRGVGLSGHSFGGLTALLASSNARGRPQRRRAAGGARHHRADRLRHRPSRAGESVRQRLRHL